MGIEENIKENFAASGCEENVSERYDKIRKEKTEALYKNDFRNLFLVYVSLGMLMKGY